MRPLVNRTTVNGRSVASKCDFIHGKTSRPLLTKCNRFKSSFPSRIHAFPSSLVSPTVELSNKKTSWQAQENEDIQRVTQTAIIHELTQQQTRTIESVVPWFLDTMPASYFRHVQWETRMDHIKAISSVKEANMDLDMNLSSHLPDGRVVLTFIRPGAKAGRLLQLVNKLPWDHNTTDYLPLSRVQVYTAHDETLSLFMFTYGHETSDPVHVDNAAGKSILEYAETLLIEDGMERAKPWLKREDLVEYFKRCSRSYLNQSNPRRFLKQREMFDLVSGTEGTTVSMEKSKNKEDEGKFWFDVAVANSLPQVALELSCRYLSVENFDVVRAHLDIVSDDENGDVTFVRMSVAPIDKDVDDVTPEFMEHLQRNLKRLKWLDGSTMDLVFDRYPSLGITRGEIITAFCSLAHSILAKQNAIVFSKANILETVTHKRYIHIMSLIADLFLDRFHPKHHLDEEQLQRRSVELRGTIQSDVEDTIADELLNKMIDIVGHTLRTNIYLQDRYALSLRLDPVVMAAHGEDVRENPYGVVFVHGRRFNGFHVRFRDIARGGLRLVTPHSPEQYALESARHYDECYGLAYAQQLKNKDIPEGGSKAVCLVDLTTFSDLGKEFVKRKSVKAFTDSILDLIVDTSDTRDHVVDFLGRKEILYLGPDEQIIPEDINWVVAHAAKRGYDTPSAFMSSKPRAGINHKEYGVTSEGVNVFLDVALKRKLGVDPTKDPFTIKMTGGPDGDVAGNEIKILIREYGDNAKIVGLADHSGCAEDPDGLDHEELLRLVHGNFCICNYNRSKLGPKGELYNVDTEEGMKMRNTMHNRVKADAFVPAGGRPNTIDIHNYKNFLLDDGLTPSSPLIVEAANLFITSEARKALFDEAGVLIVKDSSANKCGVICSSYEICAAMMLSEGEFYDNKDIIVDEVLAKLRYLARLEAELLFREFDSIPGSLTDISQIISNSMNTTKDALIAALDTVSEEDRESLMPLFRAHIPETIASIAFDRVHERVPEQYIKNAIASCLASKMVYREGTQFIDSLSKETLAQTALKYLQKQQEIAHLKEALSDASNIPQKEKHAILELLEAGGARTALALDL